MSAGSGPFALAGLICQFECTAHKHKVRGSSPRGTIFKVDESTFMSATHARKDWQTVPLSMVALRGVRMPFIPICIIPLLIGALSHCRLSHGPIAS